MNLSFKSSFVLIALALSACSSDSDNSDELAGSAGPTGSSELEGVWELACYQDTDLPAELDTQYRKTVLSFTGGSTGSFTSTFSAHASADCSTPAIADDSGTLAGTYSIGSGATSEEGLQVTEIDIMTDSVTPLGGDTISPVVDLALILSIYYFDNNTLYFGNDDDPDAQPPVRDTSIDFTRGFVKAQ